jgi:hypothetical protein
VSLRTIVELLSFVFGTFACIALIVLLGDAVWRAL